MLLFRADDIQLSIERISEGIKTPRSTTYRYINTLVEKGLLEKAAPGVYQPGIRLLALSAIAGRQHTIAHIALPFMEALAAESEETVLLTQRNGHQSVCIERVEARQGVRITFDIGQSQPLHAGASSKILLAYLPEDKREAYLAQPMNSYTEHTTTDPDQLRSQIANIRALGYCISESEVDRGATSVSVPIFDHKQHIVAALSVAGPSFRIDQDAIARYIDMLNAAAQAIGEQTANIGYSTSGI